jgi:hypothetical protein
MAGWDEKKVKKYLGFPENYRIIVVFTLGYEGQVKKVWDNLEEKIKNRIAKPRKRKPITENFFFNMFKQRT